LEDPALKVRLTLVRCPLGKSPTEACADPTCPVHRREEIRLALLKRNQQVKLLDKMYHNA